MPISKLSTIVWSDNFNRLLKLSTNIGQEIFDNWVTWVLLENKITQIFLEPSIFGIVIN